MFTLYEMLYKGKNLGFLPQYFIEKGIDNSEQITENNDKSFYSQINLNLETRPKEFVTVSSGGKADVINNVLI